MVPFQEEHAVIARHPGIRTSFAIAALPLIAALNACELPATDAAAAEIVSRAFREPDSLWAPIRRTFGQEGEAAEGYFRIDLPRSDLRVRIGKDALSPDFEFTSYFGFAPAAGHGVLAIGEIVLRSDEVNAALAEARRQGVHVTALHNHLVGEEPRVMYMHVMAQGTPGSVATRLRSIVARTATPFDRMEGAGGTTADWSAIDAVLGRHSEAEGDVAEYVFPRKEQHSVHGLAVESTGMLETASEVVFQQLGDGRFANTGELYVLPQEVEPVVRALEDHGLNVTAIHNHMLDEQPTMYWIHWYATGEGATLARGVAAALAQTNSQRKAVRE